MGFDEIDQQILQFHSFIVNDTFCVSRAFDSIKNLVLLQKLERMGVRRGCLQWIA